MTRDRFTELYRPFARVLAGYARNLTHNRADAEDLVQGTLLKAWAARARFVEGTNFRAWLCTIMRHEFMDRERVRRDRVHIMRGYIGAGSVQPPAQEPALEYKRLIAAIRSLKPRFRQAIELQLYELSYRDCADILGCAEGTAKSRVSRARAALAAKIDSATRHQRKGKPWRVQDVNAN
ncbi:MAG TPA: RNA polymerase sigma factor [Alphaproteobacteria bacterium]